MTSDQQPQTQAKKRFGIRRALLLLSAIITAIFGYAAVRSLLKPAWFQPEAVDYRMIESDKADLVALYDDISEALNRGQTAVIEVTEQQLNRWIRSRGEIWPDFDRELGDFRDPQIRLLAGNQIAFAASYNVKGWPTIPTVRLALDVDERIVCRLHDLQIGRLSVPASWVWPIIRERIESSSLHRVGIDENGLNIFNEWVWDNGEVPYRVSAISVAEGQARIELSRVRGGRSRE